VTLAGYDRRMSRLSTVLAWSGAILFPFALFFVTVSYLSSPATAFALAALVMLLPVGVLRRRPLLGLALMVVVVTLAVPVTDAQQAWYHGDMRLIEFVALDLAVGYVAVAVRRRWSVLAAVLTLAAQVLITLAFPIQDAATIMLILVLAVASAWVAGQSVRQRRQYRQQRQAQEALRAVQAERLRIARELHDMIAHSIGVIAIQAGMGRRVIDSQPAEARNALAAIEDTSRDTLAGLRRMLGTLRHVEPEPGEPPLEPAPGLADLDGLVARSLDAGLRVDVQWRGERRPLPPDLDLSAYRVIQESVTNVLLHAGVTHCTVVLDQGDDELTIEVADDGRGGAAGTGFGIAGMRERVGLLRGEFSAGPRPEGGFRVTARIPVPAAVR
jgi:signal transduction histidine kinase